MTKSDYATEGSILWRIAEIYARMSIVFIGVGFLAIIATWATDEPYLLAAAGWYLALLWGMDLAFLDT